MKYLAQFIRIYETRDLNSSKFNMLLLRLVFLCSVLNIPKNNPNTPPISPISPAIDNHGRSLDSKKPDA